MFPNISSTAGDKEPVEIESGTFETLHCQFSDANYTLHTSTSKPLFGTFPKDTDEAYPHFILSVETWDNNLKLKDLTHELNLAASHVVATTIQNDWDPLIK